MLPFHFEVFLRQYTHIVVLMGILLLGGCKYSVRNTPPGPLSPGAQNLIDDTFRPFQGDTLVDHHVHIIGLGNSPSGIEVNPHMQSLIHPFKYARFKSFMDAAGIDDLDLADEQYVENLELQIGQFPTPFRVIALALDRHYLENGEVDPTETEIYIPNDYILELAATHSTILPAISVHPYRLDAVEELERCYAEGARVVKWVPNAMGIDPSSALCDSFYAAMSELNMVLLSHAGEEKAIDSEGRQHLGNPLLLRRALDHGVRVVVAHCATAGKSIDLDDPELIRVENFELFMRLLDDPKYDGLIFGDISALTLLNQVGIPLKTLLERQDLNQRLFYGSDYPLPAVSILNNNSALVVLGFLDRDVLPFLEELQALNPLLYNFVLMRLIKHPETGATFSEELFLNHLN